MRRKKSYYMEKLAEIFGKKLNETFVVTNPGAASENEFSFTENGFVWRTPCGDVENDKVLHMLLKGEATIKKGPWKPNVGDQYFYIDLSNPTLINNTIWEDNELDNYRYKKKLLYRSEKRIMPIAQQLKERLDANLKEIEQLKLDI